MAARLFLSIICFLLFSCDDPLQDLEEQLTAADTEAVEEAQKPTCILPILSEPEFPGGIAAWKIHLKQHLKHPNGDCIEGKVVISFIVAASGQLENIYVIRGLNTTADEAALEVLRKSPTWIPRTIDGKVVDSRMTVMIKFRLE